MQEKFNETLLVPPYKASYSPLLTMKRSQKNSLEPKTPELLLIEQLLHVKSGDKVDENIPSKDVLLEEINKEHSY